MEGVSRPRRIRRGAGVARLLGLFAVVLGLLAMHGLASSHHAAAAVPGQARSEVAAAPASAQPRAGTHRHEQTAPDAGGAVAAAAGPFGVAVPGPTVPACDDDCPDGWAVLCVAVVAAAAAGAALVAAAARRRAVAASAPGLPQARAPAAARRVLPGPDPVAELCVSRT